MNDLFASKKGSTGLLCIGSASHNSRMGNVFVSRVQTAKKNQSQISWSHSTLLIFSTKSKWRSSCFCARRGNESMPWPLAEFVWENFVDRGFSFSKPQEGHRWFYDFIVIIRDITSLININPRCATGIFTGRICGGKATFGNCVTILLTTFVSSEGRAYLVTLYEHLHILACHTKLCVEEFESGLIKEDVWRRNLDYNRVRFERERFKYIHNFYLITRAPRIYSIGNDNFLSVNLSAALSSPASPVAIFLSLKLDPNQVLVGYQ